MRILIILKGYNASKMIHTKPINIKIREKQDQDYYFLMVIQCYANPDKLRVPSAFAGNFYFI